MWPSVQPSNVQLNPPSDAGNPTRPAVLVVEGDLDATADQTREYEASVIARVLDQAHTERWEIRDRHDEDRWRACRWGDMAILLPARTGVEH